MVDIGVIRVKRALILANGTPPSKRLLQKHLATVDWFVCADGGANTAARFGCVPDLIIGDLDSVSKDTLSVFRNVEVKKLKDQNSTDLEKALKSVIRKNMKEIIVLGATGGRFDHAIGNMSALAKFSRQASITFIERSGRFISINRYCRIKVSPGHHHLAAATCTLQWNCDQRIEMGIEQRVSRAWSSREYK